MDEDDDCFPKPGEPAYDVLKAELTRAFATPDSEYVEFNVEDFLDRMRKKYS